MSVGLVLGAGGVMGGAWLTGALAALAEETGWDPRSADRIVGTSAGAMIAGLLGGGVHPARMVRHARERGDGPSRSAGGGVYRPDALPSIGPGSWSLIARSLRRPLRHTPAAFLAGWAPTGVMSTRPLQETIRRVAPEGWAPHAGTWIVACDYATGRRVVFGRPNAPDAELAEAVAASCAIPGFYAPVTIGGRRYVDGGMWSPSNLDVLRDEPLDAVVCLNPTSSLAEVRASSAAERAASVVRGAAGRRLGREARRLRERGIEVMLIQPTAEDLAVMGVNLMRGRRRREAIETAMRTTARELREGPARELLGALASA